METNARCQILWYPAKYSFLCSICLYQWCALEAAGWWSPTGTDIPQYVAHPSSLRNKDTVHCALCTKRCIVHGALCTVHCALYTVHWTLYDNIVQLHLYYMYRSPLHWWTFLNMHRLSVYMRIRTLHYWSSVCLNLYCTQKWNFSVRRTHCTALHWVRILHSKFAASLNIVYPCSLHCIGRLRAAVFWRAPWAIDRGCTVWGSVQCVQWSGHSMRK